jgi:hypothetical protein
MNYPVYYQKTGYILLELSHSVNIMLLMLIADIVLKIISANNVVALIM